MREDSRVVILGPQRGAGYDRRLLGVSFLSLVGALAASSDAAAQGSGRRLDFSLQARATYDSNVSRESKPSASAVGIKPADVRYGLTAAVDGAMPIGRESAYLRGTVGYDFYQNNPDLKRARADLTGGIGGRLGPCQSSLNGGYLRALADLAPVASSDKRNTDQTVITYGGTASCPLFGPIGASLSVQRREISNDGAKSLVNSHSTVVSGNVGYQSRTLGSIGVIGSYSKTSYDTPPVPTAFNATGFDSYSVGLQYTRPIGTRLTGIASVSYFKLNRDDTAINKALTGGGTNGTAWNVGLSYAASSRLGVDLNFSDSTGATSRIGSSYQREQRYSVHVRQQFSRKLNGGISADQTFRRFSGQVGGSLGQASKERRSRLGGNLGYDLGRNVSIGADAMHEDVHTDLKTLNYKSNRFGASVSVKF